MAVVRTQNGKVITSNNKVSCQCCTPLLWELDINIGQEGDCACGRPDLRCFGPSFPAPNPFLPGKYGVTKNNPFLFYRIQGSFQTNAGIIWRERVSVPTLVRLSGSVGGEIYVTSTNSVFSPAQPPPEWQPFELEFNGVEFDCNICPTPASMGRCSFSLIFPMYPNTNVQLSLFSGYYLQGPPNVSCVPFMEGKLESLGAIAP